MTMQSSSAQMCISPLLCALLFVKLIAELSGGYTYRQARTSLLFVKYRDVLILNAK